MYTYHVYGLCLRSDLALPGMTEGAGEPDVQVLLRKLSDEALEREESRDGYVWGRINHDLQFVVEGGTTITVDNRSGIGEDQVAGYVTGVLMAVLLRQRGLYVLHASSVALDGKAIGFVGDSGWGKSTLAAYFCQNGYYFVNDDLLVIDLRTSPPVVLPGMPRVHLLPDVGAGLQRDYARLPFAAAGFEKRMARPLCTASHPVPLARLYCLSPADAPQVDIRPLGETEALLELLRHSRATNLMSSEAERQRHFQESVELAKQVPISQLDRTRSLGSLPQILSAIEADLAWAWMVDVSQ